MGIRNDVFGLEQIYQLQIEGQWSTKGDVWNTPSPFTKALPFGYFGGGGGAPSGRGGSGIVIIRYNYIEPIAILPTPSPRSKCLFEKK